MRLRPINNEIGQENIRQSPGTQYARNQHVAHKTENAADARHGANTKYIPSQFHFKSAFIKNLFYFRLMYYTVDA